MQEGLMEIYCKFGASLSDDYKNYERHYNDSKNVEKYPNKYV